MDFPTPHQVQARLNSKRKIIVLCCVENRSDAYGKDDAALKIFISWSGERSRAIALGIHQLIGDVLQNAEPFVSAHDLEPGERWADRLDKELVNTFFGVVCLTPENLTSTWIHYECGALRKAVEKSRVCPILFEIDSPTDVVGPLLQFQSVSLNKEGLLNVLTVANRSLTSEKQIDENRLDRTFQKFWPDFKSKCLDQIPPIGDEPKSLRTDRDLLEEALILLRQLPKQLSVPSQDVIRDFRMRVNEFRSGGFDLPRGRALGGQIHEYFLQFRDDDSQITHYDRLSVLGGKLMRAINCEDAVSAVDDLDISFTDLLGPSDYYGSGSGSY